MKILQFNIEDPYGYLLEKVSPSEIATFAHEIGADALVIFARDGWGRSFYRSKMYPKHPKVEDEFLKTLSEECKKYDIKLVAMVCHTSNRYLYDKHPEWVQRDREGNIIALDSERTNQIHWPLMCLNSGFLTYCTNEIEEVHELADYIMLDSFRYQPDPQLACYCENCKLKFRETYGYELPENANWNDPKWWKSWFWRYSVVVNAISKLKAKSKKPIVYNSHPAGWGWRANTIVERGKDLIDVVFAESSEVDFQPLGFLYEISKLSFGLGAKEVWTTRNAFHIFNTPYPNTRETVELGVWEIVAAGASPMILVFLSMFVQYKEKLRYLRDLFRKVERVEDEMKNAEPISEVSILYSNISRDYFGKNNPDAYNYEVRGFFYALMNMNYQISFVGDLTLIEKLPNSRVLIIPNKMVIRDDEGKVIRNYAKNGGKIISTFLTSTCVLEEDTVYCPGDFLLSDLIGAHFYGIKEMRWGYVEDVIFGGYEEGTGSIVMLKIDGGEPIMNVYEGALNYGFEYTLGRSPPPKGNRISWVVKNKDKSIYIPFQFGRSLFLFNYSEYYEMLRSFLGFNSLISSNYDGFLKLICWKKNNKLLVHLINHAVNSRIRLSSPTTTTFSIGGGGSFSPIKQTIPLKNVLIRVNEEFSRGYLLLKEKEIEVEAKDHSSIVKLPEVDVYDLLILEK